MIIITTPTGRIGSRVVRTIAAQGEAVRVIVRDPSRIDPEIRDQVEVVRGSHADVDVMHRALEGADSVLLVVPPDPAADDVMAHYLRFARSAREGIIAHGVRRVVTVSSLGRGFGRDAGLLTPAFAVDDLIESTGAQHRSLRMPFYLENLLAQVERIKADGVFSLPNAAGRPLATVATRDVAATAADLLLDRSWSGQDSVSVIGPDALTPIQMAGVMGEVLGRPVRFEEIARDAYAARMLGFGMSTAWVRGLIDMAAAQDDGVYDREQRDATSPAATSFRQWCEDELEPAARASRQASIRRSFEHLHAADPVLAQLIDKRPDYDADAWLDELPTMDMFGCLVFQIIGQQISVTAARAILGRLQHTVGDRMPRAADLVSMDDRTLRDLGVSWRKAATLRDMAARFADERLSEERLSRLPDDDIVAELTQIKGIGPWTVHGALLIALRRADVVPTGDIMLRNTMKTCYGLDHVPTEDEVLEIAAAWHPYSSLGVNLIFAAAELDGARS